MPLLQSTVDALNVPPTDVGVSVGEDPFPWNSPPHVPENRLPPTCPLVLPMKNPLLEVLVATVNFPFVAIENCTHS